MIDSSDGQGYLIFRKRIANPVFVWQDIDSVAMPLALNQWYTVRVVATGDTLTCYIGGIEKATESAAGFPQGKAGLWSEPGDARFDDVVVLRP